MNSKTPTSHEKWRFSESWLPDVPHFASTRVSSSARRAEAGSGGATNAWSRKAVIPKLMNHHVMVYGIIMATLRSPAKSQTFRGLYVKSPNWQYIPLIYHLYIAYWVIIYHLPPIKGTRNSYWFCNTTIYKTTRHITQGPHIVRSENSDGRCIFCKTQSPMFWGPTKCFFSTYPHQIS